MFALIKNIIVVFLTNNAVFSLDDYLREGVGRHADRDRYAEKELHFESGQIYDENSHELVVKNIQTEIKRMNQH